MHETGSVFGVAAGLVQFVLLLAFVHVAAAHYLADQAGFFDHVLEIVLFFSAGRGCVCFLRLVTIVNEGLGRAVLVQVSVLVMLRARFNRVLPCLYPSFTSLQVLEAVCQRLLPFLCFLCLAQGFLDCLHLPRQLFLRCVVFPWQHSR